MKKTLINQRKRKHLQKTEFVLGTLYQKTHYQRLLNYIVPDFVHVLYDGKIIKSGNKDLAERLEEKGYDWVIKESV